MTAEIPLLLDLFCCEGGCSAGYSAAGFRVVGVDLFRHAGPDSKPRGYDRARYPFPAWTGDALAALRTLLDGESLEFELAGETELLGLGDFAAIGASPPCQFYSTTKHLHDNEHPDLLAPTRALLRATGLPYIIENVEGAKSQMDHPVMLCGATFARVAEWSGRRWYLRRHRLFESNVWLSPVECTCALLERRGFICAGVYGTGSDGSYELHEANNRRGFRPPTQVRAELIGAPWMTSGGLSQSIPPAYTAYLGEQLIDQLDSVATV